MKRCEFRRWQHDCALCQYGTAKNFQDAWLWPEVIASPEAALSRAVRRDMLIQPLCDLRTQFELTLQIIPNREPVLSRPTVKPTTIGSHDLGGGCPPYLKSGVNQSLLRLSAEVFLCAPRCSCCLHLPIGIPRNGQFLRSGLLRTITNACVRCF